MSSRLENRISGIFNDLGALLPCDRLTGIDAAVAAGNNSLPQQCLDIWKLLRIDTAPVGVV